MLGGSVGGETGTLKLKAFTGGATIATWTNTGTLADAPLSPVADVSIPANDWYDLYLVAGGIAETAIIKGLRILTVQE
jgi:hypothetical protein